MNTLKFDSSCSEEHVEKDLMELVEWLREIISNGLCVSVNTWRDTDGSVMARLEEYEVDGFRKGVYKT